MQPPISACVDCGDALSVHVAGRRRKRCALHLREYRRKYQHSYYFGRKYPGLSESEKGLLDREAALLRDKKEVVAFQREMRSYCRKHKGLYVIFSDLGFEANRDSSFKVRERICRSIRAEAEFLLKTAAPATSEEQTNYERENVA